MPVRFPQRRQLVALLLQVVKGGRDVRNHGLVERSQRLAERSGQASLVRPLGKLWLAELDEQADQRVIAFGAEMEQVLVQDPAVLLGPLGYLAAGAYGLGKPVPSQSGAAAADEEQVLAQALRGDEEPAVGNAPALRRAQPAACRQVQALPIFGHPAEFQPGVAQPLVVLPAEQKVPFHLLLAVPVRLDSAGGQISVKEERERQRQHLRLPGAVVATQQQPAVAEPEFLAVVVEDVHQPGAQRLPPRGASHRQPGSRWRDRPPTVGLRIGHRPWPSSHCSASVLPCPPGASGSAQPNRASAGSGADPVRAVADQAQRGKPPDGLHGQAALGPRHCRVLAPMAAVLGGHGSHLPDEDVRRYRSAVTPAEPFGKKLSEQQRGMAIRTFFRHA